MISSFAASSAAKLRRALLLLVATAALGLPAPAGAEGAPDGGHWAQSGKVRLWYRISGRGPMAILPTPGWGPSSDLYLRTFKPLESIFTIVYLDTRGSGRSQRPSDDEQDPAYSISRFTADLEALRAQLKQDRVWIIGHSMGSAQAMQYALDYPAGCAGLILIQIAGDDTPESTAWKQARRAEQRARPELQEAVHAFDQFISGKIPLTTDEELKRVTKPFLPLYFYDVKTLQQHADDLSAGTLSLAANRGVRRSFRNGATYSSRLKEISVPTLIVAGAEDTFSPLLVAENSHFAIPRSKLIVVEKAAHMPWIEHPERFFGLLRQALAALGVGPAR